VFAIIDRLLLVIQRYSDSGHSEIYWRAREAVTSLYNRCTRTWKN